MKARVKATGEIVEVSMECNNSTDFRKAIFRTKDGMSYRYDEIELTFDKINARVKSTGDIFGISDTTTIYPEHYDKSYNITEVEFLDVKGNSFPKDDNPDYWTRLEHTYAGMFMKSFLDNFDGTASMEILSDDAIKLAHALVQKLKEKEERK